MNKKSGYCSSKEKKVPSQAKVKSMSEITRNRKLCTESKRFRNISKRICSRAQASFANPWPADTEMSLNGKEDSGKEPDELQCRLAYCKNKLLHVKAYSHANPSMNRTCLFSIENEIRVRNETEAKYPGTDLVLNFNIETYQLR
jgi:hypothetical protein